MRTHAQGADRVDVLLFVLMLVGWCGVETSQKPPRGVERRGKHGMGAHSHGVPPSARDNRQRAAFSATVRLSLWHSCDHDCTDCELARKRANKSWHPITLERAYVNEDVQRAGDEDLLSVLLCGAAHESIKLVAWQFGWNQREHDTVLAKGVEALEALD